MASDPRRTGPLLPALLSLTLLAFAAGCPAAGESSGTTSATTTGTGGKGGSGTGTGGAAGHGGTGGSTGTAGSGGHAGSGGQADAGPSDLALCVLNAGTPADPCATPSQVDFGAVPGGTQVVRLFRVDNVGTTPAVFDAVTIGDAAFTTETVTFTPDPATPGAFVRKPAPLPVTTPVGSALYFEVTYTADGTKGPLPADHAAVSATVGGQPEPVNVPLVGSNQGCPAGKGACDADPTNGCETDLNTLDHCGACDQPCLVAHGAGACDQGTCTVLSCDNPYQDCDGNPQNGCEANLLNGVDTCGSCTKSCKKNNTNAFCNGGNCNIIGCTAGFADCNLDANDGCETDVHTSVGNCGGCNIACSFPHAKASCASGTCAMGACDPGFADCDNDPSNGCEADLGSNAAHCGTCNHGCLYAHGIGACVGGACTLAACANGWGNCDPDPTNGCETNTLSSPANCGTCGHACSFPNATPLCGSGACLMGACSAGFSDCDGNSANGCEKSTATDPQNCGFCGNACAFPHAGAGCSAGACTLGACDPGFVNCNNAASDGCEVDTQTDAANCGGCGTSCLAKFPHGNVSCAAGACQMNGCQPGYYDLDGNPANGCEYACTFQSAIDLPDEGFVDANCDGIDGDVAGAVFVDTVTGNDQALLGTRATPMKTITGGLSLAKGKGLTQVLVSNGTYAERVSLVAGISIYGGYSAAAKWARSGSYIADVRGAVSSDVPGGRATAMEGLNIAAPTTVDLLTIETLNTAGTFLSSYAFYCSGCSGLTLKNSSVQSAAGRAGTAGTTGNTGASGGTGSSGGNGSCDVNTFGGAGGPGGTSTCSRPGGAGGKGGDFGPNNGATGSNGTGGTLGGAGGAWGDPGAAGKNGGTGAVGTAGINGAGGNGGATGTGFWVGAAGAAGLLGGGGNGGGGGGGGGAQSCTTCNDGPGNGGGGGGAGGCGGTGGAGGTAGGGSFGVFLVSSSGAQLINNMIASGNGGSGGSGGNGGNGGIGGNGGFGATTCTGEVGQGGNGGAGGNGGRGGHGGGGAGGPSYALYRVNSGTGLPAGGNTLGYGAGGLGGTSSGNAGSQGLSGGYL